MRDIEKIMKVGSVKALRSIKLLARPFLPGLRQRMRQVTMARTRMINDMVRTAQGKPIVGCNRRNMIGNTTLPILDPIEAQPIAMGRFVVKLEDITARAGMYAIPPPMPTQKP
jgi:hypothetical protein